MRSARMTLIAVPAAVAGLLLAGCAADNAAADASPEGASGVVVAPAATTVPSERSRAQFVADTLPLCEAMIAGREAKAKQYLPSQTEPPTVEQLQAFYAAFAPTYADFMLGFAKLVPAPSDRDLYATVREGGWRTLAGIVKAGQDTAISQHLLDTDEAELHDVDQSLVALGVNPEC